MNDDERLRSLLHRTVSGVEPRDALPTIRSRTSEAGRTGRPWLWGAAAAVVATAATIAAVALVGGDAGTPSGGPGFAGSPSASTSPAQPSATPSAGESSTTPQTGPQLTVPVYYVGETSHGPRLYREFWTGHSPLAAPELAAVLAVEEPQPKDPDYFGPWKDAAVESVSRSGGTITVSLGSANGGSLHDRPAGMSQELASMAIEQLLYTVQAAYQSRDPVQLLLDGKHSDTILGVPTAEPLAQGDAIDVLAQVWIIEPAQGATVHSPFKVSGLAAAFEANVQWELKQGETVVKQGFTTAAECCTMAPYSFTVKAPPGHYTLVVHDSDPSGGEGPAPWQDTKDVVVE